MNEQFHCVFVANGETHAQQVRAFLEAAGIGTIEQGEALRNIYGFTLDGLGGVKIFVAEADVDRARSLLESADAGDFQVTTEATGET